MMKRHKGKRKILKIVIGILIVLLIAGAIAATWFASKYKDIIRAKLPDMIEKSSEGLYHARFRDVSINIITRSVTLKDLEIWHDSARYQQLASMAMAPKYYFHLRIPRLHVGDIVWEQFAKDKTAGCGQLRIIRPEIVVTYTPDMADSMKDSTRKESKIDRLFIDALEVKNANITCHIIKPGGNTTLSVIDGDMQLTNWEYSLGKPIDSTRFLMADYGTIMLQKFSSKKQHALYATRVHSIYFDSRHDSVLLSGVKIKSTVNRTEYYRLKGKQTDMFDVSFGEVQMSKFDWRTLKNEGTLYVEEAIVKNASINDYFSRLAPPNMESKFGKSPPQLVKKIPIPLRIKTIKLVNATGSYTELNDVTKRAGTLLFTSVHGTITNLTNIPEVIQQNPDFVIKLQGKFMRQSNIAATFTFPLTANDGSFHIKSSLHDLDAPQLDKTTQALALAEIKSAHISKMEIDIYGNERRASSDMVLLYNDLKIKLQKMNKDSSTAKRMGFLSFLANNVLLYPANPMPGEEIRKTHVEIIRGEYKSFFNLVWKNIFEGTINIVARNDDVIEVLQKKGPEKGGTQVKKDTSKGLLETILDKKDKKDKKKKRRPESRPSDS